jgi:hypothetical protein
MIRFSPGVELRVASRDGPGLCLTATVDLLPLRGQARRRSDEALLHDTGTVGLSIHAGVRIPL